MIAQTVPEAATRASLVERGDADLSIDLLASDVPALQQRGKVKVFSTPIANGFTHIAFNTKLAPFDKLQVRQAIGGGDAVEDMFQASIFGRGAKLFGVIGPARRPTPASRAPCRSGPTSPGEGAAG